MAKDKQSSTTVKLLTTLSGLLDLTSVTNACKSLKSDQSEAIDSRLAVFCDQIINAAIVAAISGISTFMATSNSDSGLASAGIATLITFGWTFLNKLKQYRGIKDE